LLLCGNSLFDGLFYVLFIKKDVWVQEQEGDKKLQRATNTTVVAKKRLVRYNEGAQMYSIGRNKFQELAKDAHAILKIGRIVLVDLDIFDKYLETFRVEE